MILNDNLFLFLFVSNLSSIFAMINLNFYQAVLKITAFMVKLNKFKTLHIKYQCTNVILRILFNLRKFDLEGKLQSFEFPSVRV